MKLQEHCTEAEARLRRMEAQLLEFRPEAVDQCLAELPKVLESLQRWTALPEPVDAKDRVALKSLQQTAGRLRLHADFASNLCLGWIQLRLGVGYTNKGQPWVLGTEPNATYEG